MPIEHCPATQKIPVYLDGSLSGQEQSEMARHVLLCRPCATAVEEQRQVRSSLRGLAPRTPPKQLEMR
ncbi:MAG: anti-sigma factor family protein, partial [Bryobacteraceae bacterium]